jgi:hypothetical protein
VIAQRGGDVAADGACSADDRVGSHISKTHVKLRV